METRDYARFVQDCLVDTLEEHTLTEDQLVGVYLSWCSLLAQTPGPCESFWGAMAELGVHERRGNNRGFMRLGLRMTGPAALDYILASQPSLN